MTIDIDGIKIKADTNEALAIAHDIDALVNEQSEWDYSDCDGIDFRRGHE
jgi:hypothetical protein